MNLADNLSLRSNIQPLEPTYFIRNDTKLAETEANADKSHGISFKSCIHEKKSLYEYDLVSRTTEILDEPNDNYPTAQDCHSDSECSNC